MNLEHMTDEWVDGGQYCAQDIINMRDHIRLLGPLAEKMAKVLECERDRYPVTWGYSHSMKRALAEYRGKFPPTTTDGEEEV